MLAASRTARALPHLARSVATSTTPKAYAKSPAKAPVRAATPAAPRRAAYVRKTPAAAAAAPPHPAEQDGPDDGDMSALLPEIPPMPSQPVAALAPTPAAADPILTATSPPPAVAPAPVSTSSAPLGALSSFPSTTSFPSAPLSPPTAAPAHQPEPFSVPVEQRQLDWATSFHGMSSQPFSEKQAAILMRPLLPSEIEIKPDGIVYLPEIQYRRILNKAFGPGGWGMVPRGEMTLMKSLVSREWGLVAGGRLISVARGEQTFFDPSGVPTATEGCKSNALMRCCKDLGIASELWEPSFIRSFKASHCIEAWTEHGTSKKKQRRWRKKGNKFEYPLVEAK